MKRRITASLAAAAVGVAATLLTSAAPAAAVVGGHDATGGYRAHALLQVDPGDGVYRPACGATLLSYRGHTAAVSAAHCLSTFTGAVTPANRIRLRVGSTRLNTGRLVTVTRMVLHPDWAWATIPGQPVSDLAVLTLAGPTRGLPAIRIAPNTRNPQVRLLGFGFTDPADQGPLSARLQQLDTHLSDPAQCADALISAGEVCVSGDRGRACDGDGGGPALQHLHGQWMLLGAASRILARDCATGPTIYTDVRFFTAWISKVIASGTPTPPPGGGRTQPKPAGLTADQHRYAWIIAG